MRRPVILRSTRSVRLEGRDAMLRIAPQHDSKRHPEERTTCAPRRATGLVGFCALVTGDSDDLLAQDIDRVGRR